MNNMKVFLALLITFSFLMGCEQADSDTNNDVQIENAEETSETEVMENEFPSEEAEEETPQTVEERIAEIKELYAKIQSSPNQNKDCKSKSKTTMNYDVIEEGIPFENSAKQCQLEDGLMYEQVNLQGYEWAETARFYYKDGQKFFAFVDGGAEAYGYEYRVYYDREGEAIRVLLAENDYDGQEVGSPFEIKDEGRKKEILDGVAYAEKEGKSLLNGE
jgi:hypothetical protein